MLWNEKRVSIIVLLYNGMSVLPRSLASIFQQDYPNLEIIVSDDGSSDYKETAVREMIEQMKTSNIQRVKLLRSDENLGTVKNVRCALAAITGEYYMTLGAGDELAAPNAVSIFMKYACLYDWKPLIYTGQMIMRDSNGEIADRYALDGDDITALRSLDRKELRTRLNFKCCIAAVATLYHRDFPQTVDAYDTSYRYYEDYPTFIAMARKKIMPVYVDRVISVHYLGDIAKGGNHGDVTITDGFCRDRILLYQKEICPYLQGESARTRTLVFERYEILRREYLLQRFKQCIGLKAKISMIFLHPWVLFFGRPRLDIIQHRFFKAGIACLLIFSGLEASGLFPGLAGRILENIFFTVFCCSLLFSAVFQGYRLCLRLKNFWRDLVR